ncbi:MAG: FkbM family methyltransferase [Vicinamibacterales bacterium]
MSAARGYRFMFYLTGVVALLASGLAWKIANQSTAQSLTAFALERDKQYPFVVDAYGFKYQGRTGNSIDEFVLRYGAWEKDRLFFVRDYLKTLNDSNAVVIDVGANTGHHSLFYSQHAARVLAFEPFPPVIAMFKQNLALNPHIKNVELFEVGLGDTDAELPFSAPADENHGQGSFRAEAPQNRGMKPYDTKLRIVAGDEYLKDKNVGPVAFIKIDVEGFEEPVLKGLHQLIEKHRPLLQVEVSPPPTGTVDSFARFRSLIPENYEFFVLMLSQDGFVKGTYQLQKLDPSALGKDNQVEVIACPKERLSALPGR